MGLRPRDVWSLSAHEYYLLVAAYLEKREEERNTITWVVANVMYAGGHIKGSLASLLAELRSSPQRALSPLQKRHQKYLEAHPELLLNSNTNGGNNH